MEDVIRKNTVPQTIEDMMIYQLEEMKDVKKMFPCLKILCELADNKSLKLSKRKYESYGSSGGKESRAYAKKSAKVFSKFWSEFKRTYSIPDMASYLVRDSMMLFHLLKCGCQKLRSVWKLIN